MLFRSGVLRFSYSEAKGMVPRRLRIAEILLRIGCVIRWGREESDMTERLSLSLFTKATRSLPEQESGNRVLVRALPAA